MGNGFAFGRDRRLRRRADFERVQGTGRRVTTPHFVLLVSAQPDRSAPPAPSRLGLVVSRKVGTAVARARVKRHCREVFRTWPALVPPGIDLVWIAKPGAATLGLEAIRAEVRGVERHVARRAGEALADGPRGGVGR